jgi:hypothetical protein
MAMEDFFVIRVVADGSIELVFKSPLFANLVIGLPRLWSLLSEMKPDSESRARQRLFGTPHGQDSGEDFWEELVVPEIEGELRADRDVVFQAIADWVESGDGKPADLALMVPSDSVGLWIGVLGQVRLMISEETGISEEELANSALTDRRRALALGLWVYGALIEALMPYWE